MKINGLLWYDLGKLMTKQRYLKLSLLVISTGSLLCMQSKEELRPYLMRLPIELRKEIKLFAEDAVLRTDISEAIEKAQGDGNLDDVFKMAGYKRSEKLRDYVEKYPFIVAHILEKKFPKEQLNGGLEGILDKTCVDLDQVKILVLAGANPNRRNLADQTAVQIALQSFSPKRRDLIKMLLLHGADPNAFFSYRATPLLRAVLGRDRELVQMLLEFGANVYKKFKNDQFEEHSPLELVREEGCFDKNDPIRIMIEEAALKQMPDMEQ